MKKLLAFTLAALMAVGCIFTLASCKKNSSELKVVDIPLTEEKYAFAVQKGDSEMLGKLNDFLAKIQSNGTFNEIMNKYFGDGKPAPVASAATMKTDGSQLIVATNATFEPFEYLEGANYYGIDMEIMSLFAAELGKELYINNMDFDAVCLSVSAAGGTYEDEKGQVKTVSGGTCDVAAAGLTVTETRKESLDFSSTYYSASQMIIVAKDDTTFDNCKTKEDVEAILNGYDKSVKVGVQNGTTGKTYCVGDAGVEGGFGFAGFKFETVGYTSGAVAAQNIKTGNIKMVVIDEGPAKAIVAKINAAG